MFPIDPGPQHPKNTARFHDKTIQIKDCIMPREQIASFTVSHLQILDEKGRVDKELEPKLDKQQLLAMYRWMRLAREFDQRMLKLQRQGRLGTFAPNTGQEAISVPIALAMQDNDWFVGAFRELGGRLVRGEPMVKVLQYYNGFEEGNIQPEKDKRLLPTSVIISSQCPHAVGLAYASKYRGEDTAAVCLFGDGGSSEGDFFEAMNFAKVWNVPVVFVCQNNQWAISVPLKKQTASQTLAQKGIAAGIESLQVDGNDPLAMHVAITEALDRARKGDGPTFIEAVTYRLMMHTTADDPKKYRQEAEEKAAWAKEPMLRFKKYLEDKKLWDDQREEALLAEIKVEVEKAVQEFETPVEFAADTPFDHVYGTKHDEIEEQRQDFLANVKLEADHG